MRRFLTSLVLFVLIGTAGAQAPPAMTAEAQAHLDRGLRLYDTQSYAEAIAEFRAGYQLVPHPDFLYALGQAERKRGNCRHAIDAYRAYLRTRPAEREAALARGNIATCEAELAAPPPPPAPAAPPPRTVHLEEAPWFTDRVGDALCLGGLLAGGAGAALLALASHHAGAANDAPTYDAYEAEAARASRYRLAGAISLAAGGALVAGGILRFALHDRPRRAVTVSVTPGGAAVALSF